MPSKAAKSKRANWKQSGTFPNGNPELANSPSGVSNKRLRLADLRADPLNANAGSPRGNQMLEDSLQSCGAGRSILIDKNGIIVAGNKTAEVAGQVGIEKVIVVPSDGRRLVAVQRTDLDLSDPASKARLLASYDNRVGELNLSWLPERVSELSDEQKKLLWTAAELEMLLADFKPAGEDEQGRLDEKSKVKCPECGAEFVP